MRLNTFVVNLGMTRMSRTLITGGLVVTMDDVAPYLEQGAVIVHGNRIEAVGAASELSSRGPFDAVIGSADHIVLPSLVNAHQHSVRGFFPGPLLDEPLELALLYLFAVRSHVDEEDLYWLTVWHVLEQARRGVTGVCDMVPIRESLPAFGVDAIRAAYRDVGVRATIAPKVRSEGLSSFAYGRDEDFLSALPPSLRAAVEPSAVGYKWQAEDYLGIVRSLLPDAGDTVRIAVAPDWFPNTSIELYRQMSNFAREHDLAIATHFLESRYERLYAEQAFGRSPVTCLDEIGFWEPRVTLAHGTWLDTDDIARLVDRGAAVATCPGSNLRLFCGVAPVKKMLAAGLCVGLGSDCYSLNDDDDLFDELRLCSALQRSPNIENEVLSGHTLLKMLTTSGARILGHPVSGQLKPGEIADVVALRGEEMFFPRPMYLGYDPLDVIAGRCRGGQVSDVCVNGEWIIRDGRHRSFAPDAIRARVLEAAERYFGQMRSAWAQDAFELGKKLKPYVVDQMRRLEASQARVAVQH